MNFGTSWLTRMRIAPILLLTPNRTFCGPARDTVLTNRQTEKLKFDTNYITSILIAKILILLKKIQVHIADNSFLKAVKFSDDLIFGGNDLHVEIAEYSKVFSLIGWF